MQNKKTNENIIAFTAMGGLALLGTIIVLLIKKKKKSEDDKKENHKIQPEIRKFLDGDITTSCNVQNPNFLYYWQQSSTYASKNDNGTATENDDFWENDLRKNSFQLLSKSSVFETEEDAFRDAINGASLYCKKFCCPVPVPDYENQVVRIFRPIGNITPKGDGTNLITYEIITWKVKQLKK